MLARMLMIAWRIAPFVFIGGLAVSVGAVTATVGGCIDFSDAFPDDPNNTNANDNANGNSNDNTNSGDGNTNSNSNSNGNSNTNSNNGGTIGNLNTNADEVPSANTNGTGVPPANTNTNDNTNSNSNENTNSGGGATIPTTLETITVAQTGGAVPGQAATVAFTEFGNPVIDANGRVAFWALYGGTGAAGFGGLYVWQNGTLSKVLDDNPATTGVVPGRPASDYFGKFQKTSSFDPLTQDLIWAGGDRLLFVSLTAGSGTGRGFYRWRATDGNFARIADIDQLLALYPDAASGAFIPTFGTPGVSDAGFAIFGMDYRYFTKPPGASLVSGQAIFTSNGVDVTIIRDTIDSELNPGDVPGQEEDAFFQRLTPLTTLNAAGDMLFEGRFFAPDAARGIFLHRNNVVYRVIDNETGNLWAGLPSGAQVTLPSNGSFVFANGPLRHIAVDAQLTVSGSTRDAVLMFDFATSLWYELTGPNGAPATDLVSGVNNDAQVLILSGGHPYIVGGGERVQLDTTLPAQLLGVNLTWLNTGGSINDNRRAVASYSRNGSTGLVFWTSQQLLVVADANAGVPAGIANVFTISDPRRDRVSRSGLLNNRDEVVFRATLTASGQAVYLVRAK